MYSLKGLCILRSRKARWSISTGKDSANPAAEESLKFENLFVEKTSYKVFFLISPEFSGEDKVESLLVLLGCFVMFRHNLLGLLGGRPCQWHCSLQELEMYFFWPDFSLFFVVRLPKWQLTSIKKTLNHNQAAKRQNLPAIVRGNFSGYFLGLKPGTVRSRPANWSCRTDKHK